MIFFHGKSVDGWENHTSRREWPLSSPLSTIIRFVSDFLCWGGNCPLICDAFKSLSLIMFLFICAHCRLYSSVESQIKNLHQKEKYTLHPKWWMNSQYKVLEEKNRICVIWGTVNKNEWLALHLAGVIFSSASSEHWAASTETWSSALSVHSVHNSSPAKDLRNELKRRQVQGELRSAAEQLGWTLTSAH